MKTIYIIFTILIILYVISLYTIYFHYKHLNEQKSKTWFITFGGPEENYHDAVKRLTKEVEDIHVFDHVIGYTDLDLKKDNNFWEKHSAFCEKNNYFGVGYGCWIWKPYLILKTMELMDYNDVISYTDAGCTILNNGEYNKHQEDMTKLIQRCKQCEILFTSTSQPEKYYSKTDLIKYLNMDTNEVLNSAQYQAGVLFIKKTRRTVKFLNHWYNTMCIYHLADGNLSRYNKELPEYKASRHDQSVFSLLAKKYGFAEDNIMKEHLPILISRKRGG